MNKFILGKIISIFFYFTFLTMKKEENINLPLLLVSFFLWKKSLIFNQLLFKKIPSLLINKKIYVPFL